MDGMFNCLIKMVWLFWALPAIVHAQGKGGNMDTHPALFYPAKNLGAWGDGGAMVTSDTSLYEKVKKIRNYGQEKKYFHSQIGWNSRLDSLQAIVLAEKLLLLDQWNKHRRRIASRYYDILKDTEFSLYHESPENEPVHHLFVVTHKNRDLIQSKLNSQGIATGIHYPVPIHKHKCFANEMFAKDGCVPHAEAQSAQLLSLPMHPNMTIAKSKRCPNA